MNTGLFGKVKKIIILASCLSFLFILSCQAVSSDTFTIKYETTGTAATSSVIVGYTGNDSNFSTGDSATAIPFTASADNKLYQGSSSKCYITVLNNTGSAKNYITNIYVDDVLCITETHNALADGDAFTTSYTLTN